jgi:hypothetical protein
MAIATNAVLPTTQAKNGLVPVTDGRFAVRGRGRPPIPAHEVAVMRKLRMENFTLQKIGYITERSIPTVAKYTANIANTRRPDTSVQISRRTGLAIA